MSDVSYPNPDVGSRNWKSLCKVEDGVAVKVSDAPFKWKTDGGQRPTDEYLAWSGYYEFITEGDPTYNPKTQKLVTPSMSDYIVDSENLTVTFRKTVVDLTTDEINDLKSKKLDEIRAIKNDMLSQSDWTQAADQSEELKAEWATYRQKLRDLLPTITDPLEFDSWPSPPGLGPNSDGEVTDWAKSNYTEG
jgi:hypothetical protein|tara:strand:- start:4424 stop:4996 length:573 start_codon:yes stop_codon:yes gene_type:complete